MPPDEHQRTPRASRPVAPTVEVEIRSRHAAVVTLSGEHDLNSRPALQQALARAIDHPNVLVDLTDCTFIESSAIGALVSASRLLAERKGRLALVIPPSASTVSRVLRMTAISTLVAIHDTRSAAEESIQPGRDSAGDEIAAVAAPAAVASN